MRCALVGNFGVGNAGDEWLRLYFLTRFPEIEWTVLSASPQRGEVPRLPFGFRSLLLTSWIRTFRALRRCDAVVFGGGTLFTDVESASACGVWWWHAYIAHALGKPLFLAFQGIGPFGSPNAEKLARWVAARAAFVSVRDPLSAARVRAWGVEAMESFDPVALLFGGAAPARDRRTLVLAPRRNSGDLFLAAVGHARREFPSAPVRVLSLQEDAAERRFCDALAREFSAETASVRTPHDFERSLSDAAMLVTERYHAALGGFMLGVPISTVHQKKGDKLDAFVALGQAGLTPAAARSRALAGESALRQALLRVGIAKK